MKRSVLRRVSLGVVIALAIASTVSAIVAFPMLSAASPSSTVLSRSQLLFSQLGGHFYARADTKRLC